MLLDKIEKANDIKNLNENELEDLACEIRQFMVEKVSKTGGHLASSLGTVELTMALHLVYNLPNDKIIWDVGHQAYTHKILTGRKEGFDNLRSYGGMSGFPKPVESDCDAFIAGHSSTSISAGLGMVRAREISGEKYDVVTVLGDGSLTGGMAYEALNNASELNSNMIIVLNDNNMAISQNVGNVSKMMTNMRIDPKYISFKGKIARTLEKAPGGEAAIKSLRHAKSSIKQLLVPGMFFEDLGLKYIGPVDGHNIKEMVDVFKDSKRLNKAVVVHVMTKKGKGYKPAEENPEKFHGIGKFDIETGETKSSANPSYSKVFGDTICKLAKDNKKITCITAAMPDGVGLKGFEKEFPKRFYDVGIAEEHAVTFAAGQAKCGVKPYVCIYSAFLQRAYDQIVHDVCIQNLPVTFIIDRAGIVGADGETHQGLLDISFLSSIPNMTVLAPKNGDELISMLEFSESFDGPLAIRFPRGEASRRLKEFDKEIEYGKAEVIKTQSDIALVAVGNMVETAFNVSELLNKLGYRASVINARFLKPFDKKIIKKLAKDHKYIFTLEEGERAGGFGERVAAFIKEENIKVKIKVFAIEDEFVPHGDQTILRAVLGLDEEGILERIKDELK